jgi:serine/threonine protein phosphatase PrpC
MHLDTAQITAIGGRATNQDALASACEDGLSCFVVSDGTGGHQGGEIAAHLVTESILEKFKQEASFGAHALGSYVDWAIGKVATRKSINVALEHMSATVATVLIDQSNRCALWAHLGDTRIYMFRQGKISMISKDHSLVQRLVDGGYAKYTDIRQHPQRSVLFAAIGTEGDTDPEVSMETTELLDGDAFLLCTDGFWEWVHDHQMEHCLSLAKSSDEWLMTMNALAEFNIGTSSVKRDNFSAIAILVHDTDVAG